MMRNCILVLFLLPCLASAQSPWARNKAGFYAQAGFNFIPTYSTLFGRNGQDITLKYPVSERQLQFYGEYGITAKTTLVLSMPVVFTQRGDDDPNLPFEETGWLSGIGNYNLALRHQFLRGKIALAGTLRVGFPSDRQYPDAGLRLGYNALTLEPMLSVGKGFRKTYGFLYGSYGYRGINYSHFLRFGGEAGVHLGKFWLIGFSELVYSLENGSLGTPDYQRLTGLYINDQGWWSLGAKAIWQINRFVGINASYAGAAWAQLVPKSPGISAAFFVKWD